MLYKFSLPTYQEDEKISSSPQSHGASLVNYMELIVQKTVILILCFFFLKKK